VACDDCSERQALRLDPAKLFAAVPIAVAPVLLKQQAAAALEAAGVPMSGSKALGQAGGWPSRRWIRPAVMAAAALVVVVLVGLLTSARLGDGGLGDPVEQVQVNVPSTTTTADDGTFTAIIPEPEPDPVAPAAAPDPQDPVVVPPGGGAPAGPSVAPTTGTISTSGSAGTVSPPGQFPTVTWSTSGATTVSVSGPGLASSATRGSQAVCPGTIVNGVCRSAAGTYTYTLTASGPGGSVQRSASLTIG
jgi:hypothetical protein